jgi:transporter family protein
VALIDKGSVVIALLLSFWVLHETVTLAKLLGAGLIVAGLLVIARG